MRFRNGPGRLRPPGWWRDRIALIVGLMAVASLGSVFVFSTGTKFLMPGPLISAHGAIVECGACHTRSGSGKLSWLRGLVAGDPLADSKACLVCHKMPDTAFNAHGASASILKQMTDRSVKMAGRPVAPLSAYVQDAAFPAHDVMTRDLYCATCHQEHQGADFKLSKISNEQCRSCHVVKFDGFAGGHPDFDNYPSRRRTRIVFDHAGHFNKHYPEVAKKDPAKRIPANCASCHDSRGDRRIMALAPFEQTCAACHLDQINGKERASGPKGIAFLTLPGLDLQTLKKKNAAIGEWPEASDAAFTPFMKLMIARREKGQELIKTVDGLNLQDLSKASDDQITAVTSLVWEIKSLFSEMISGKAPEVLAGIAAGSGAKLTAADVADLTANLPRDVVVGAQQQWMPALASEMANGPGQPSPSSAAVKGASKHADKAGGDGEGGPSASRETGGPAATVSDADRVNSVSEASDNAPGKGGQGTKKVKFDPPACLVRLFGQCLMSKGQPAGADASGGTTDPIEGADAGGAKTKASIGEPPPGRMNAGVKDGAPTDNANTASSKSDETSAAKPGPSSPSDELLFPTPEELREIDAYSRASGTRGRDRGTAGAAPGANQTTEAEAPAPSQSDTVDTESWADYGGWYRQDYAIFYRPTGHKDRFIHAWLRLTGISPAKVGSMPAAAVFDFLTGKDAQGVCTKCHSVDETSAKGRHVNYSPVSIDDKKGRFTRFAHEPHLSVVETTKGNAENGGCLACHSLSIAKTSDTAADSSASGVEAQKSVSAYLKSYEQGNPQTFTSNFASVKKEVCRSCHKPNMARQDCVLCHTYHVHGAMTPVMATKIPAD